MILCSMDKILTVTPVRAPASGSLYKGERVRKRGLLRDKPPANHKPPNSLSIRTAPLIGGGPGDPNTTEKVVNSPRPSDNRMYE